MIDSPKRPLHCWASGPDAEDGCPTTCMREADHEGPHEWTRDDRIGITFAPSAEETAE